MDTPKGFSQASAAYENASPREMSAKQEDAWDTALADRGDTILDLRDQLLDELNEEKHDVAEWDGDDPRDPGDPDFQEDGAFCYRRSAYVRVILKDGRIYFMEDGWDHPKFESQIHAVEEAQSHA